MYEGLLYGDPKMRILRILWTTIYNDHTPASRRSRTMESIDVFAPAGIPPSG